MSFLRLLRAEWTKLRTVRGWIIGLLAGGLVIVVFGLAPGRQGSCGQHGPGSDCTPLHSADGREVTDSFTFVHRTLTGDGTITARVADLSGKLFDDGNHLVPWAKAGLIVRDGTTQGAAYAAVMRTGEHGVRLQYDYTHDQAGASGGGAVWLRLTRTGEVIKAEQSADGSAWTTVGTARLPGLPQTVTAGLFVTSPEYSTQVNESVVLTGVKGGPSQATAAFDHLATAGSWSQDWEGTILGARSGPAAYNVARFEQTAEGWTLTGSGDIAPSTAGGGGVSVTQTLVGTFVGLIFMVVVGAMSVTAEFRRGLIRTTFAAGPHRARVLAAKALVTGAVAFAAGLVAAWVVVRFGVGVLRDNGVYVSPVPAATEARMIAGTAALLAGCAVLAVGLGALLRRGVTAVTVSIVVIVLPYLLSVTVLPLRASDWLLRVTPAAAFALQQAEPRWAQIDTVYSPADGYFPLSAWGGLAVLALWIAAVLGGAAVALRRRDA
ncbi:ABC transporter permease subunit [Dactylosporangium sp. NPDC051485]|uniref:ABC transporter permease subunit n=1 Tax=Dactylosporangium sp. NPDC051485 TaxID=3154846 RepID=UPI003449B178